MGLTMSTIENVHHAIKPEHQDDINIIYFKYDKKNIEITYLTKDEYMTEPRDKATYIYSYVMPDHFICQLWERSKTNFRDVKILSMSEPVNPEAFIAKSGGQQNIKSLVTAIQSNFYHCTSRIDFSPGECIEYMNYDNIDDNDDEPYEMQEFTHDEIQSFLRFAGFDIDYNESCEYHLCVFPYASFNNDESNEAEIRTIDTTQSSDVGKVVEME